MFNLDHAELHDIAEMKDDTLNILVDELLINGYVEVKGITIHLAEIRDSWARAGKTVSQTAREYILRVAESSDH